MRFTFVTLFPSIVEGYFSDSIIGRAITSGIIKIDFYDPRDFSTNKHKKVDAPMIGGGAGMLMSPQPLFDTLSSIRETSPGMHVIFLTPVGKKFQQNDAKRLVGKEHIVFVSGRYEGIDERVIESEANELFSIGDFILTGGELASMVMCDAISRNVKGVLGNSESLEVESFEDTLLEAPSFTKPINYENREVISELLKGNHSKITALKRELSLSKTKYFRPDLYQKVKTKGKT
ncbi:MAG: tRNA (guanosine(37)-N1)-methyltransferase TrmD [Campylobacterota bacterium]|nr:tRNA (guanosine(37)-N1)-methyltransferase TrmD [Campylobacterota bacterium]